MERGTPVVGVLLCCGWLLVAAGPLSAQPTTASIIGKVADDTGAVLPGVMVTATSPSLQVRQVVALTDSKGEYRLTLLPIGTYSVRYGLTGFQTIERTEVRLTVGFIATLDVVLNISALSESVTVSGASPVVDVASATPRTEFRRETLEELPTTRNGILSVLIQSPGVRPNASTLDVGGSQFTTQPSYNNYGRTGDQWVTNDGVLTTSANGTPEGVYWDFTSFEEAAISTVGATAEMVASGVSLNSVVKSGGNAFHGGGTAMFSGPWAESSNINDRLAALGVTGGNHLLERWDANADLGGRLIRNKLWFYTGGRRAQDDVEVIGSFKPDGTPGNLLRVQQFATAKVSYQLAPSHKLVGFYQWNSKDNWFDIDANHAWETRARHDQTGYTEKIEWQGVFGNALAASAHYGYYRYDAPIYIMSGDKVGTLDLITLQQTGASLLPHSAVDADQYRSQVHAALTWFKPDFFYGKHEFKAGFDYTPGTHDWDFWDRTSIGSQNYYLRYRNGVPFQIATWNLPAHAISKAVYTGAFAQDTWVLHRLTLSLGVRYDRNDGYVPESSRVDGMFAKAATFPKVQFAIWNAFAPRVHFAYDVTGRGRTALKGGWGRFNRMRFTTEVANANGNDRIESIYTWRDLNGDRFWAPGQAGEVNLDPNGPDFVLNTTRVGLPRVPNPDERQPTVDEFSLNLEHELVQNLSVRVTGVYSRENNLRRLLGINRPYSSYSLPITNSDPGPDGVRGTADDSGTLVTYYEYPASLQGAQFETLMPVTDPSLTNTYQAFEVTAHKRSSNNWQFMGTFGSAWRDQPLGSDLIPLTPNAEIFAARHVRDWYGKVGGSYRFTRLGVLMSANFTGVNGEPFARTALFTGGRTITSVTLPVEAYGTRHRPNIELLDARFQKEVQLGGHKVSARVDLFNALNANPELAQTAQSGRNFLRPTSVLPARIAVFGLTYTF